MRSTHGERSGLAAFLHRRGDRGRGMGCGGGHTLAAGYAVVGIDGTQRYRVSVLSWGGVGERTREGQFLGGWQHHQYIERRPNVGGEGGGERGLRAKAKKLGVGIEATYFERSHREGLSGTFF